MGGGRLVSAFISVIANAYWLSPKQDHCQDNWRVAADLASSDVAQRVMAALLHRLCWIGIAGAVSIRCGCNQEEIAARSPPNFVWRTAVALIAAFGTRTPSERRTFRASKGGLIMNNIVYIVGAVVIVLFILGFLGLR